ncbi:diguanylate cyclase [Luteimonas sp. MC1895]|uniref:sensor domain-containing diguanylate cyclase n=1 Tax=Luteimonas sp. MC1895 TaxID=2819513 RepID=UPI0018F0F388|nr:diguanylate cyclase [Luteimonas sp. MC1895]MBJ6979518.1 diguanylate cyclase [Luteimonas sp. MC1895]
MGNGERGRRGLCCSVWLLLLLLCALPPFAMAAKTVPAQPLLVLQELRQANGAALDIEALRSGRLDGALARLDAPLLRARQGEVGWWRVTAPAPIPAGDRPQLVLRSPFVNRVQAWVPGRDAPVELSIYGAHADPSHAPRALVVDLPEGLPAGSAVWLRVEARSSLPMQVAVEPLATVQRDDLAYTTWRTLVLSVIALLAVLAFVFRAGTGESSFAWFGGMLCFAVFYLVSVGGDARLLPGAEQLFSTTRAHMVVGGFGVVCSNLFQRSYLDLPGKLPGVDRLLWIGTALSASCGIGAILALAPWQSLAGNAGLVLSAALLLVGSTTLALRGDRSGRVVMVSWLPLMVFTTLVATGLMELWSAPPWLAQGLAGSFALASLLLAIGLADKLLELRRDRDQASALAVADKLTGLLNRAGIEAELRRALQADQAGGMCIAFVDLDNFKPVNDEHGHGVGDQCLRVVSQRVRNQLRGGDLIGRYGGDEFLVVLPATPLADALAVAERMRVSVNGRPLTIEHHRLRASLSIGVAESRPGDSVEALVERADAALYASKQAGRNRVSSAGAAERAELAVAGA